MALDGVRATDVRGASMFRPQSGGACRRPAIRLALLGLMMALLAVGSNAQPVLRKVVIESPATAVCLDGTQPAVFVKPGDPANWVFYMQGGALCTVSVSFIFITRA